MGILKRHAYSSGHLQLGCAVRHMRAKQGVSQHRLAGACGIRWRDLARLERGRYHPSLQLLEQLCAALGVTWATLELEVGNERYIGKAGGIRKLRRAAAAGLSVSVPSDAEGGGTVSRLPLR
jgi:transcriptional regulator with XRE-family HTH domain